MNYELQKIRQLFREFYGLLPVKELVENKDLIKKIEIIEKQLRGLLDADPAA
ncbi:MAG: hypothetical protein JNL11_15540 [Bdellovibrionaceae bacterium]|nr:hypothetical protein [Pseudobdellovibrionaceae bacterium]